LEAPGAIDNVPFADNKIRLLEIDVNEKCPLINIELNKITKKFPKLEANILGVVREEKFKILKKNDVLKLNDKAYVIINSSQMQLTLDAFGHNEKISSKFLIIDTPNDGGLRMEKQALSYASLAEKLLLDDRIPNDSIRCMMLDKAIDADWEIDKSILKSGLCDGMN